MPKLAARLIATHRPLIVIVALALALRLALLPFIQHPGIADPNHYYDVGRQLATGHGFTLDYIWQYDRPPASVVHPEDSWMPLTSVLAAAPMAVFGINVQAALLLFVLIGALLPVVTYLWALQLYCSPRTALFAAVFAAVLPEFLLNSLRTDTTLPNALFVCAHLMLLTLGLRRGNALAFGLSGVAAGLAYLTRNENTLLLLSFAATLAVYALFSRRAIRWRYALLVPLLALVVASPWLVRNVQLYGRTSTLDMSRLLFRSTLLDFYSYNREFSLQSLLASQSVGQLVGKRLFEMAASAKLMYTTLDVFLPVAVAGGLILISLFDRERLLILLPALILLAAMFLFYSILLPFYSQSGSFKKAYLTLIPMLLPLGAYAVERVVANRRAQIGVVALAMLFTGANAVELVRADVRFTNNYLAEMRKVAALVQSLPDMNGDGQRILMAQDQFMLSFLGIQSIAIPNESRETILDVARRYHADYLMFPPARPALDPLDQGVETDARFVLVARIPGTLVSIYKFVFPAAPSEVF
jgi:4-amino-4-deoxy-L-arabinose transferase-like glycosyltransferase